MDWNHSWPRELTLKNLILSPSAFESDQSALGITFKQQETKDGSGEGVGGKGVIAAGGRQGEGDSRGRMIRFQLWCAAVQGSGG